MSQAIAVTYAKISGAEVHAGAADPTVGPGVVAPQGSIYMQTTGAVWVKTGGSAGSFGGRGGRGGSGGSGITYKFNPRT